MSSDTTVAVLGTGIMGLPMARNAATAGLDVSAWNRTAAKAEPLREHLVAVAADPAEAVRGASVVVTMLSDADAVLEAIEAAADGLGDGVVWAQMSTVGLEGLERCAAEAQRRGLVLVDAPVAGTKAPAEAGELAIFAAGPADAIDRCKPFFDAVGRKTVRLGDAPGAATRLKLAVNHWVLGLVEAIAETLAFAEAIDVAPEKVLGALSGGPLDTPYLQMKGKAVLEGRLDPSFSLAMARKDAGLIVEAAEAAGLDPGLAKLVAERMQQAIDAGHGDEDLVATYYATAVGRG